MFVRHLPTQDGTLLTGQYLQWTTRRPDAKCWWCNYKTQTREHLFKNYPQWKSQQKALWAAVREETSRSKDRFKISELFADERCSKAILEVGRTAGPPVADEEPGSEGEERTRGIPCTGGGGRGVGRGGGRLGCGGVYYRFSLFIFYFICQAPKAEEEAAP